MSSFTPKERSRAMVISSMVRPATSTSALGLSLVSGRRRVPRPAARIMAFIRKLSLLESLPYGFDYRRLERGGFEPRVAERHLDASAVAQVSGQLLGQEYRTVLPAGAAERHHQILEAALLIVADAGVDQREHAGQELVYALLLIQVVDHRRILAGQLLEALFAPRIGEAAAVKNETAPVPCFVLGQPAVEGKTAYANDQIFCFRGQAV